MTPPDENDNDKRRNPWGRPDGGKQDNGKPGNRGPWGQGGGGRGGNEPPPDLDEILRKAQENLRQVMPRQFRHGGGFAGLIVAGIAALWLASGFYTIQPGENGVIQRFGALNRTKTTEGLGYRMPWPIETLNKVSVSQMRRMEIGFAQSPGRPGTTQKQDLPDESLMLTSDANIVDLDMIVLWNIKSAEDFLFNIEDPDNTIKKVAESAIREVVGQTEMFQLITQARAQVAQRARDIMMKNLDEYHSGVYVSQILIQEAEVHPDVQEAFQDVQSAKQDAQDVQNRAEAYRQDILPRARGEAIRMGQEAQGYKLASVAKATGEAARFDAMYQSYLGAKDVTRDRIYIETMENVLGTAQKIILDDKAGSGVVPYLPLGEMNNTKNQRVRDFNGAATGARTSSPSLENNTDGQVTQ
jgi:membrane protease subunit HflK